MTTHASANAAARPVAYVSDIEGRWDKLVDFARLNDLVELEGDRLRVRDGALFVFGGDAVDRGPRGQRVMATLLEAKRAQPDQVVLLAGNRDINKLRLHRELRGHPPARAVREAPGLTGAPLLKFIFENTMGAKDAFAHRAAELLERGAPATDEDVVESYLREVDPRRGSLIAYLGAAQLAHREGGTLFVHGAVTAENLGVVPAISSDETPRERIATVDGWVDALNAFYKRSIDAYVAQSISAAGETGWAALVAYQAPLAGTRENATSVVYGRPTDREGNPTLPPRDVIDSLKKGGVYRVIVGHTPAGDCPAIVRDAGFELVVADTSYAKLETGASVTVRGDHIEIRGKTLLDEEARDVAVEAKIDDGSPLGLRTPSGELVKARLASGAYLLFRALPGYRTEVRATSQDELARAPLAPARATSNG